RAQRSICLLSVLTCLSVKHLMLCTRFACCLDRCFLKAPQSRNRCVSALPSPGTGACSRCASVSVEQFIASNSSRLERGTLGNHAVFDIAPERDQQPSCQRDNADAPDATAASGEAHVEPLRKRAPWLIAQPTPGK